MDYINQIICGDCIEVMKTIPDNSVDAVVTDPPYGLEFMGKNWDKFKVGKNIAGGNTGKDTPYARSKPAPAFYQLTQVDKLAFQEFNFNWSTEALRVLKPGGYLLAFGGTRTYHRLVCGIEDAGFEIRDTIMWLYGSGFPKSLDISKAIDKRAGVEREVTEFKKDISHIERGDSNIKEQKDETSDSMFTIHKANLLTLPATPEAKQWAGWGTALKPACEPIVVARKPLSESTVAENVLKWGTGGIDVDGGRIGCDLEKEDLARGRKSDNDTTYFTKKNADIHLYPNNKGRFPANVILDEEAGAMLDEMSGTLESGTHKKGAKNGSHAAFGKDLSRINDYDIPSNTGGASRFFYCAKASKGERNRGCEGLEEKREQISMNKNYMGSDGSLRTKNLSNKNYHPTVKPLALMKYLIKLVSVKGAIILDPFCGSGTTAMGCKETGRRYIAIDNEKEYIEIAKCRVRAIPELLFV